MSKKFEFTYSAPTESERREIEYIKNQYEQAKLSTSPKLIRLRKLDQKVRNIPAIVSLVLGLIGTLMFGLGLAMVLEWNLMAWGIVLCVISCLPISIAYFSYIKVSSYLKNKYSEEILKLSNELLEEEK